MKRFFFHLVLLSAILMQGLSCTSTKIIEEPLGFSQELLDELSTAMSERDEEMLWELADNPEPYIADNALRALIHTGSENQDRFIRYAIEKDSPQVWYVAGFIQPAEYHVNRVFQQFVNGDIQDGVCHFFNRVGNSEVLNQLLSDVDRLMSDESCSKAAGSLLTRLDADPDKVELLLSEITASDDEEFIKQLLYGLWRTDRNRPSTESTSYKMLTEMVYNRADLTPTLADQYLLRIVGRPALEAVVYRRPDSHLEDVQFAVEVAAALHHAEFTSDVYTFTEKLLSHSNPHVRIRTLESLVEVAELNREWISDVDNLTKGYAENPEVTLKVLELMASHDAAPDNMLNALLQIEQENPYLINLVLPHLQELLESDELITFLGDRMYREGIRAFHSAAFMTDLTRNENTRPHRDLIRELYIQAAEDLNRSVLAHAAEIFMNTDYFDEEDLLFFQNRYLDAVESGYGTPAQLFADVVIHLHPEHQLDLSAIPVTEIKHPDWQLLHQLGERPELLLETDRGDIRIELFPELAPFTVSSITQLTRKGYFNNVPFHRVVRNFVIQGGDNDRRDGLGGPGYRIVTEPQFETFSRGLAGMASAGPDTEGSQFFITHTWTPHLDGLYTIFGRVIEGMEIVDTIQTGDFVENAAIIER